MAPVIEWNAHLFHPDMDRYPLHPRASYVPDLQGMSYAKVGGWSIASPTGDVVDDYSEGLRQRGVDRCVVVHPEPYGDDHSVVLHALDRRPGWLGTSLFYPRDKDAPQKLEKLVQKQPRIISTRFHAHRGKREYFESFNEPGVRALWRKAVELGLIIELHIGPEYGLEVADVLRDIPDSVVLIDHLAEAGMGTAPDFATILDLAAFRNVYMKLSGLGHFCDDAPLFRSAIPFTTRVVDTFGPSRMVWGSGTPTIVDVHMAGYSKMDRDKVKGGNLAELLPWPQVSKL